MLTNWIDGWYEAQLWRGAVAACRLHRTRILCLAAGETSSTRPDGIWGLAGRSEIDGVLVPEGSLSLWNEGDNVGKILEWFAPQTKVVSLGQGREGIPSILPDGGGIVELVEHLVNDHGCRGLAYLGGPPNNSDSLRRLDDFLKTCQKCGIESDPRLREVGHFNLELSAKAMERLLAKKIPFDAVVCANDSMAMGASRVLANHGLSVPEVVCVVGYDDSEESRIHQPPLTTVRSPTYQIGFRGLERCLEELEGRVERNLWETHPTSLVIRKSCGCKMTNPVPKLVGETTNQRILPTASRVAELMASQDRLKKERFLQDFLVTLQDCEDGELEQWQEILFSATRLALRDTPIDQKRLDVEESVLEVHAVFSEARESRHNGHRRAVDGLVRQLYVTMNKLQSDYLAEGYSDRLAKALQIWCPHVRCFLFNTDLTPCSHQNLTTNPFPERFSFKEGVARKIPLGETLLPPEVGGEGEVWIGVPILHGEAFYGIILFCNWTHSLAFIEHMRLVVSNFFDGMTKWEIERQHRSESNPMVWIDPLTSLSNRHGLLEIGEQMAVHARREGLRLAVVMVVLTGLGAIQKEYGQEAGQTAIATLGEAIATTIRSSDAAVRWDENTFAVVFLIKDGEADTGPIDRIRESNRNLAKGKPWISVPGFGLEPWDPRDGRMLSEVLVRAKVQIDPDGKP